MTQTQKALLLASAGISVALLAVFDLIPEAFAQYVPLLVVGLLPAVGIGTSRCSLMQKGK